MVAASTGAGSIGGRISGLLSARLEDLDLEAGLLTVREKGNHERDLPLNDPTCDALRQWLEARSEMMPDSDYLFIGMHGKPLSRSGVYGMLDRLREKGGICRGASVDRGGRDGAGFFGTRPDFH